MFLYYCINTYKSVSEILLDLKKEQILKMLKYFRYVGIVIIIPLQMLFIHYLSLVVVTVIEAEYITNPSQFDNLYLSYEILLHLPYIAPLFSGFAMFCIVIILSDITSPSKKKENKKLL